MRSSNPTLNEKVFESAAQPGISSDSVMTLEGTVNKSIFSILLTMVAGYWAFSTPGASGLVLPFIIITLITSVVITFKKSWSPVLVPAYAIMEGCVLGSISLFADMALSANLGIEGSTGIVPQAIGLTFGTFFCMLMGYKSGLFRLSEKMKAIVMSCMGAIFFIYLISFVMSFFGSSMPFIHSNGIVGIGFSVFVLVVASFMLLMDFEFIETATARGSLPKYMEWYGAFALLVTLVWLYLEFLRLLMKLQSRD